MQYARTFAGTTDWREVVVAPVGYVVYCLVQALHNAATRGQAVHVNGSSLAADQREEVLAAESATLLEREKIEPSGPLSSQMRMTTTIL
jgi:hypothetical protein